MTLRSLAASAAITMLSLAGSAVPAFCGDTAPAAETPFTVAAIAGTLLGKRAADSVSNAALSRAFAAMLVLVGGFVAVESVGALLGGG